MYENVELVDLKRRTDLNGKCGVIIEYDKRKKRYAVKLRGDETVYVKPANMCYVDEIQLAGNMYLNGTMDLLVTNFAGIKVEDSYEQDNPDDYHVWNVNSNGEIIDSLAAKLPHLQFVHRPWTTLSSFYTKKKQDTLKQYQEMYAGKTRDELEQAHQYVSKMFDRCIDVAVLTYMLYGHEMEFGSCGFEQDDGKIYQEFGNFRDKPDY